MIFTPELEYGLVPLEAAAAGTPTIALGKGGVLETMIGPDDTAGRAPTAVFFLEQTPEALIAAPSGAPLVGAWFFADRTFLARCRRFWNP